MDRFIFARHYRLLSVIGGIVFALLVWVATGAQVTLIGAFLIAFVGVAFAAGMWAVGRASSRRTE